MGGFLTDFDTKFRMEHFVGISVMRYAHVHSQYELYFCTENVKQKSVINGVEYEYKYPCAILSPPYTVHSMSCEDPCAMDFDRYVFYFGEDLFHSYEKHLLPSRLSRSNVAQMFPLTVEQANYLRSLLVGCEKEPFAATSAEQELMLVFLLNKLFDFCSEDRTVEVGVASEYLARVLQYVAEHFHKPIDSGTIAREFSVSRSKLDRDFKRFAGLTAHEFLESCRINHAKILLQKHQSLSVSQIAEQCGFGSETYFFPFFKRCTGMTPMEFRQKYPESQSK